MCAIDASKAFDKVIRIILWWKLAKTGLNRKILKALMAYYGSSKMKVQVNDVMSELFDTTEGTKQGGPISPDLFNEYGDELSEWISALDVGIMMGEIKVDIVQHADDITLVADTARGLQRQIDLCNDYGNEYGIQFNPDKTLKVVFNLDCSRSIEDIKNDIWQGPFKLDGKQIDSVNSMKILGQVLSNDNTDKPHLEKRKQSTNTMMGRLQTLNLNSNHIHPKMKAQVFKSYIRPVLTYGAENMELNGYELLEFKKLEGHSIKKLLRIPTRCHTTDLVDALNIEQTNRYLHRMKLKFIIRLSKNECTLKMLEFQINMKYAESFVEEIARFLGLNHDYDLETLIAESETKIKQLKDIKKPTTDMYNEKKVIAIRTVFNTKNRFLIPEKLFELIKFGSEKVTLNEVLVNKYKKKKITKNKNFVFLFDTKTIINLIYFFIMLNTLSSLCTSTRPI